jgi:hypothetical protein
MSAAIILLNTGGIRLVIALAIFSVTLYSAAGQSCPGSESERKSRVVIADAFRKARFVT